MLIFSFQSLKRRPISSRSNKSTGLSIKLRYSTNILIAVELLFANEEERFILLNFYGVLEKVSFSCFKIFFFFCKTMHVYRFPKAYVKGNSQSKRQQYSAFLKYLTLNGVARFQDFIEI